MMFPILSILKNLAIITLATAATRVIDYLTSKKEELAEVVPVKKEEPHTTGGTPPPEKT